MVTRDEFSVVRLTDYQWSKVWQMLDYLGLKMSDCFSNHGDYRLLDDRLKEVTGKDIEQLVREASKQ